MGDAPRPFTVVVTGSECTGKSTLADRLAERYGAARSLEFAREYVERARRELDVGDVEPIAAGQLAGEQAADEEASHGAARMVVRDTDLLSTAVYSRHYYGTVPTWVTKAATERLGHLYLLLSPDVPWVADGLARDRPDPAQREAIHRLFQRALADVGARTVEIAGGDWRAREAAAIAAIDALRQR